jgi:hypothetical protein
VTILLPCRALTPHCASLSSSLLPGTMKTHAVYACKRASADILTACIETPAIHVHAMMSSVAEGNKPAGHPAHSNHLTLHMHTQLVMASLIVSSHPVTHTMAIYIQQPNTKGGSSDDNDPILPLTLATFWSQRSSIRRISATSHTCTCSVQVHNTIMTATAVLQTGLIHSAGSASCCCLIV